MDRQLNGALLRTLIQEKRRSAGLNIRDAATAVGVGFSTLSRLERGTGANPDLHTIERVASWLGVSVAVLFAPADRVQAHLRARKNLSPHTAKALRELIVRAREQFETRPVQTSAVEREDDEAEDRELGSDGDGTRSPSTSLAQWEDCASEIRKSLELDDDEALNPFDLEIDRVVVANARDIKDVDPAVMEHLLGVGSREWSAATIPLRDEMLDWIVVLNDAHTIQRQRATVMEEYCHVLLAHKMTQIAAQEGGVSFRDYRKEYEDEAYNVGAAILVPEKALRRRVKERASPDAIAEHFGVSRELVEYRIKRMGLWYVAGLGLRRKT